MNLSPIKPYNFFHPRKAKQTNNTPSISSQLIQFESDEIIQRVEKLENANNFSRKLTGSEAYTFAPPWSISYGDYCDTRNDHSSEFIFSTKQAALFDIETRKKFDDIRYFTDNEIQTYIDLKNIKSGFKNINQIMRYIRLMAKDNGLIINPTSLEAEYFAKKCARYEEIEKYYQNKAKSIEHLALEKKYYFSDFTLRKNQVNGQEVTTLKAETENEKKFFQLANGQIITVSKNFYDGNTTTNYDATRRTTAISTLGSIPYKKERAFFTQSIIEILNDETGQPNRIIRSYFDKKDCIAYTKIYNLADYPQDMNVLLAVKKDLIEPSTQTTTKRINKDGSTTVEMSFNTKDATLKRAYTQKGSNWSLELEIKDTEGNNLYQTNRQFEKINQNETLTTINGRKYHTIADNKTQTLTIKYKDKELKIPNLIDESTFFKNEISMRKNRKSFWKFLKKQMPADLLIIATKLEANFIPVKEPMDSGYNPAIQEIIAGENAGIISHEFGHMLSENNFNLEDEDKFCINRMSENKELKEIYKKELEEYNKEHSDFVCKNTIKYFSEFGGTKDTQEEKQTEHVRDKVSQKIIDESIGLEELVAETMFIKTIPTTNTHLLILRAHCLMMYFPRTIACICNLIDENCKSLY